MEQKKTIVWIHGFAGCPDNAHVQEMRRLYPEYEWYSIEVDHHAKASMDKLNEFIKTNDVAMVAGTSLGGFYAMCADYDGPKLVVNPVINPQRDLKQFIGHNTYKPGRPDGQTDFEFTEEMLKEFDDLHFSDLHNVLCHYTCHDQVLGEDIKKDYEETFYYLEMMEEKILPGHFMTFKYVKSWKNAKTGRDILFKIITLDSLRQGNPYDVFGSAYQYLPKSVIPTLMTVHSMERDINWNKLLLEVENCIKEVYKKDNKLRYEPWNVNELRTKETLKILFGERKNILRHMFVLSQESFDAFKEINDNLLDLYNKMVDKMAKLYSAWLEGEEDDWRNDCNVEGRIIVEQTKEDYPDDGTGSDYEWMMERIEELEGNRLTEKLFSGYPERICDRNKLRLIHDHPNMNSSGGGYAPFGYFWMCNPFQKLRFDSLYSPQDILRIKYYWCDVTLTHQRITNEKGELQ